MRVGHLPVLKNGGVGFMNDKNNYYSFAMRDYNSIHLFLSSGSDDYDSIVVFCQQFLEKYLKHLLEITQGKSLRVHKLTVLAYNLQIKELDEYDDFFRKVQDYYFDKRYPGDCYIETTKDECDYVVNKTEELKVVLDRVLSNVPMEESIKQLDVFGKFKKE